ncbi:MAG: NifB/NifX family molybdenum-iron cluster-binding protein [Desulfobulbaceae bacterium]|nr:NifB/NifX family molybdenum-iron cluster-binding protein [Desulfobulbaceae bacterium]
MKLAISAKGMDLDSQVDPRFGRAAYLLFVDSDTLAFEYVDNAANVNAFKGAGIQTATILSDRGAEVLLTGHCGPNAFKVLAAAKIKVACNVSGTVRDAVRSYVEGKLTFVTNANVEGQW